MLGMEQSPKKQHDLFDELHPGDPSEPAPAGPGASASYYFTSYNKPYYNKIQYNSTLHYIIL